MRLVRLPTASSLHIGMACPASHVLTWVHEPPAEDATEGTASHAYMADVAAVGRELALGRVTDPDEQSRLAAITTSVVPRGVEAEVALRYDERTDRGERVQLAGQRAYPGGDWWYGTADVLGRKRRAAWVRDYKTGHRRTAAAESWQLRLLGLAAARALGLDYVDAGLLYLQTDGNWHEDVVEWGPFDLDDTRDALARLRGRLEAADKVVAGGGQPDLYPGEHCRYCKALRCCPAQVTLVRGAVETVDTLEAKLALLTPGEAGQAYLRVQQAEAVLSRVKESLKDMARQEPLPLPGGGVLREVVSHRRVFDAEIALDALRATLGDRIAAVACTVSLAGLKKAAAKAGVDLSEVERNVDAAGAMRRVEERRIVACGPRRKP